MSSWGFFVSPDAALERVAAQELDARFRFIIRIAEVERDRRTAVIIRMVDRATRSAGNPMSARGELFDALSAPGAGHGGQPRGHRIDHRHSDRQRNTDCW